MVAHSCAEHAYNDSSIGMRAEYESSDPPYTGAIYLPSSSSSEESGGELEDPSSSEGEESLSEESRAARAGGFITSGALFDLFDGALFGSAAASSSEESGKGLLGAFADLFFAGFFGAGWCAPSSSEESSTGADLFGGLVGGGFPAVFVCFAVAFGAAFFFTAFFFAAVFFGGGGAATPHSPSPPVRG